MSTRVAAAAAVVLSFLLVASAARAQAREGVDPSLSVSFGFEGALVLGGWVPMTVWIEGGVEPFEGTLIVSYPQDDTQEAIVQRRVTATPGRRTPVHMVVRPSARCDRVNVTLKSMQGRTVRRQAFEQYPGRREMQLPFAPMQSDLIVLGVAARDDDLSSMRWLADAHMDESAVGLTTLRRPIVQPADLPMTWMAYDGVLAVVVDGAAARLADPRSLAALRDWVAAGGRLVIIASDPGGDRMAEGGWRDWLPPGPQGDVVELGPVAEVPLPDELMLVAAVAGPDSAGADSVGAEEARQRLQAAVLGEFAIAEPSPVPPRRAARPIRLTETGVERGWSQRWRLSDSGSASLLAEGPVGFGWVVVLSMDPRMATREVSGEQMISVWADALRFAVADFLEVAPAFSGGGVGTMAATASHSAAPAAAAIASNSSLNQVADVPSAGAGAFVFVVVGGVALALLIGPVDALALRRLRLRHRSWLTALGWIGLASLVAHLSPRMVRSGDTILARLECVDVLDPGPDAHEALGLAFSTGVTGAFAGRTQDAEIIDNRADAFWSGVSTFRNEYWSSDPSARSFTFRAAQSGPGITTASPEDAWGGLLPGDGMDAEPLRMRLNLWTFRTFADQARVTPRVGARVNSVAGEWTVSVSGLSPAAVDVTAWFRLSDGWRAVSLACEDEQWIGSVAGDGPADEPEAWHANWTSQTSTPDYWGYSYHEPFAPRHALTLPGADRRGLAIDALAESGRWGVVYLRARLPDKPSPGEGNGGPTLAGALHRTTLIYRLVVPLPEHAHLPPASAMD